MNRYTIYCTKEQTKKALKLGAPIHTSPYFNIIKYEVHNFFVKNDTCYYFPTAEEMIGWLEEQGMFIEVNSYRPDRIVDWKKSLYTFSVVNKFMVIHKHGGHDGTINYFTRKEATIAAIDAALDYLINNKK